jgi:hypothetical protein
MTLASALAIAACGGGASGNGIATDSPQAIATAAGKALDVVRSVHVTGTVASGGEKISLDLWLVSGKGARGTMILNGLSAQIVSLGSKLYINGSPAFWKHYGGSAASLFEGKWLETKASSSSASAFANLTNLHSVVGKLLTGATAGKQLTKGKTTTIDGHGAIALMQGGGTLYVATSGPPYPLELVKRGGGRLLLSGYNESVSLKAPAPVVNLSGLK